MSEYDLTQLVEKLTQPWNIDEIDRDGVTELLHIMASGNASLLANVFVNKMNALIQDKNAKVVYLSLMVLDAVVKFGPQEVITVLRGHDILKVLFKLLKKRYRHPKKEKDPEVANYKNLSGVLVAHMFRDWQREINEVSQLYKAALAEHIVFPEANTRIPATEYLSSEGNTPIRSTRSPSTSKPHAKPVLIFKNPNPNDQVHPNNQHKKHDNSHHHSGDASLKKEMQSATESIALLNELMSGQSTPDLLEEVAKQLMKSEEELSSLLIICSPSQDLANKVLDLQEKITSVLEQYKMKKENAAIHSRIHNQNNNTINYPPEKKPNQPTFSYPSPTHPTQPNPVMVPVSLSTFPPHQPDSPPHPTTTPLLNPYSSPLTTPVNAFPYPNPTSPFLTNPFLTSPSTIVPHPNPPQPQFQPPQQPQPYLTSNPFLPQPTQQLQQQPHQMSPVTGTNPFALPPNNTSPSHPHVTNPFNTNPFGASLSVSGKQQAEQLQYQYQQQQQQQPHGSPIQSYPNINNFYPPSNTGMSSNSTYLNS